MRVISESFSALLAIYQVNSSPSNISAVDAPFRRRGEEGKHPLKTLAETNVSVISVTSSM